MGTIGKKFNFHQSESKHRFNADHNHQTGLFRGLLCFNCNAAVGHIKEDKEIALRLVDYLKTQSEGVEESALL